MAHYVDGFVLPVPKQSLDAYRRMARKAGKVWMEHGALQYRAAIYGMRCRRREVGQGDVVSAKRETQGRRNRGVRVDRLQVAQASRQRQRQGDGGQAPGPPDGSKSSTVRWHADVLGWVQGLGRVLKHHGRDTLLKEQIR